jgi:hypothetical protein
MRATQLTHFGTDQSPMMTVHSAKNPHQVEERHYGEDYQLREKTFLRP